MLQEVEYDENLLWGSPCNKMLVHPRRIYASNSCGNYNRQPYEGLHLSLTCQKGNTPLG
jgi:hypothetical protein